MPTWTGKMHIIDMSQRIGNEQLMDLEDRMWSCKTMAELDAVCDAALVQTTNEALRSDIFVLKCEALKNISY